MTGLDVGRPTSAAADPARPGVAAADDPVAYDVHLRVAQVVGTAVSWAERTHRPAAAIDLRKSLAATGTGSLVRVVVAGETSSGKSQLINALLGRPDLSPTGIGEVTACPVTFRAGTPETATVHILDPVTGAVEARTVDPVEVADYVRISSLPPATHAEVTVDCPLLGDLVLIDTPGVGGLDSGFGELTLAALDDADALLFTFDTKAPMFRAELDFLTAAAAKVACIVVAATKTDANPAFDIVLKETSARLAPLPRLAGVQLIPVAAENAQRAVELRSAGAVELAEHAERFSGIPELTEVLRSDIARRAHRGRLANLARRASAVLADTAEEMRALTASSTVDDTQAVTELEAEAARLKDLKDAESATRIALSHRFQRLRAEPRQLFEDATVGLRRTYKQRLETTKGKAALAVIPEALEGDLGAAAARAVAEQDHLVAELADFLRERLDVRDAAEDLTAALGGSPVGTLEMPPIGEPARVRGQSLMMVAGGLGIGRIAALGATSLIAGPAGWAIGGAAGGAVLAGALLRSVGTSEVQLRSHLGSWVAQAVVDARGALARDLDRRAQAVQHRTEAALPDRLAALVTRRQQVLVARNNRNSASAPDPAVVAQLRELDQEIDRADTLAANLLEAPHGPGGRTKP